MDRADCKGRASKAYTVGGVPPAEPPAGWASISTETPHGRYLVELFHSGDVNGKTSPSDIWLKYPNLRCVKPGATFRQFKRRCGEAAKTEASGKTGSQESMASSDNDDSSVADFTPRSNRSRLNRSSVKFSSASPQAKPKHDAPSKMDIALYQPLVTLDFLQSRHQVAHLVTRVVPIQKRRVMIIIDMPW